MERERARIAQDIHDELGASLTSIGLLADMGARHKANPVAVSKDLEQISQTARESVAAMDAIVWAVNPRNDSLDHFANYVTHFAKGFFAPTQIRTRFDLPPNLPAHPLPAETRHELFLLVKESFNNIARHADASEMRLQLACDENNLRLTVSDNGKGLPKENGTRTGNGIINLHARVQRLGGQLNIASADGAGVRLEFSMPLPKPVAAGLSPSGPFARQP
jgi:signal transduction histidine kinase